VGDALGARGAGGVSRAPGAFSTYSVARAFHGRPHLQGFPLPESLRGPGFYPQPYTPGGDFLHRFPTEGRIRVEASTLHVCLAWAQNFNNRMADMETAAEIDGFPPDAALAALSLSRTTMHQLFGILSARYEVLHIMQTRPAYAATLHDATLNSAGPGWSNPATAALHESSSAHRLAFVARDSARELSHYGPRASAASSARGGGGGGRDGGWRGRASGYPRGPGRGRGIRKRGGGRQAPPGA